MLQAPVTGDLTDDGSLSVYCGMNNKTYANVETRAESGSTGQQVVNQLILLDHLTDLLPGANGTAPPPPPPPPPPSPPPPSPSPPSGDSGLSNAASSILSGVGLVAIALLLVVMTWAIMREQRRVAAGFDEIN